MIDKSFPYSIQDTNLEIGTNVNDYFSKVNSINFKPERAEKISEEIYNSDDAAIQTLIDFAKSMQWQPIETAPKDGTPIIIFGGGVYCSESGDGLFLNIQPIVARFDRYLTGVEMVFKAHEYDILGATHWMPLPQPPKDEK